MYSLHWQDHFALTLRLLDTLLGLADSRIVGQSRAIGSTPFVFNLQRKLPFAAHLSPGQYARDIVTL